MTENQQTHFNMICIQLERQDLLEHFQHALHAIVFPGKTHLGAYNMIWAIECSTPAQWEQAIDQVSARGARHGLKDHGKCRTG